MSKTIAKILSFIFLISIIYIPFQINGRALESIPHTIIEQDRSLIPVMEFKSRHIDLGKLKKGENISFLYHFTNKGNVDLTIDFVSGCDCTELDWPIKTFKPGESGQINVVFLSAKKEKSETVEIDILLKNVHPETNNPILEIISYSYEFK